MNYSAATIAHTIYGTILTGEFVTNKIVLWSKI